MFYGSSCLVRREVFIHFRGVGACVGVGVAFFFHLYNLYNCLCIQKRKDEEEKKGGVSDGGEPMKGSLPVANLL